jgi:hypothetical protein
VYKGKYEEYRGEFLNNEKLLFKKKLKRVP